MTRSTTCWHGTRLLQMWTGYGFAKDYNAPRGHFYILEDNINTLRTGVPVDGKTGPMPTACWTCKSFRRTPWIDDAGNQQIALKVEFPWSESISVEEILKYYDDRNFYDWIVNIRVGKKTLISEERDSVRCYPNIYGQ